MIYLSKAVTFLMSGIHALRLSGGRDPPAQDSDEAACNAQFEDLSDEMRDLLDYPDLMCGPIVQIKKEYSTRIVEFPGKHLDVKPDPNKRRAHVIIEGAESSGSHFMMKLVAASYSIDPCDVHENTFTKRVNLYHVSQPQGSECADNVPVPLLDDLGCMQNFEGCQLPSDKADRKSSRWYKRFTLNVTSAVKKYRARGETIKVVQAVRDPDVSMLANHKMHCNNAVAEVDDNEEAFRIMFEAKDMPEVTTICYETVLQQGKPYIAERFRKAGFRVDMNSFPNIVNGNLKYSISQRSCTYSAKVYMALCPDSPHTTELSRMGCKPMQ